MVLQKYVRKKICSLFWQGHSTLWNKIKLSKKFITTTLSFIFSIWQFFWKTLSHSDPKKLLHWYKSAALKICSFLWQNTYWKKGKLGQKNTIFWAKGLLIMAQFSLFAFKIVNFYKKTHFLYKNLRMIEFYQYFKNIFWNSNLTLKVLLVLGFVKLWDN